MMKFVATLAAVWMMAAGMARLDAAQGTRYELANDRIVLALDAEGRP